MIFIYTLILLSEKYYDWPTGHGPHGLPPPCFCRISIYISTIHSAFQSVSCHKCRPLPISRRFQETAEAKNPNALAHMESSFQPRLILNSIQSIQHWRRSLMVDDGRYESEELEVALSGMVSVDKALLNVLTSLISDEVKKRKRSLKVGVIGDMNAFHRFSSSWLMVARKDIFFSMHLLGLESPTFQFYLNGEKVEEISTRSIKRVIKTFENAYNPSGMKKRGRRQRSKQVKNEEEVDPSKLAEVLPSRFPASAFPTVMEAVESLPEVEPSSGLWWFAKGLFTSDEKRERFCELEDDRAKLEWLCSEMAD